MKPAPLSPTIPRPLVAVALAYLAVAVLLFFENLLFRDCHQIFERVDDQAYSYVFNIIARKFAAGDYAALLQDQVTTSYGYGWIFWVLGSLTAVPATLLQQTDWFMVGPRLLSLAFTFGAAFNIHNILTRYVPDPTTRAAAMLALLLCPAFAWVAVRSGTDSGQFFFASLAVWHTVKRQGRPTLGELCLIGVSIAFAVGYKLSSLPLLGLVGQLLATRYGWQVTVTSVAHALLLLVIVAPTAVMLANPVIVFTPATLPAYLDTLATYTHRITVPYPLPETAHNDISGFVGRFIDGVTNRSTWPLPAFLIALAALLYAGITPQLQLDRTRRRDVLIAGGATLAIALVLAAHVKMGSYFLGLYFFPLSFPLLLAFAAVSPLADRIATARQWRVASVRDALLLGFLALIVLVNGQRIWGEYSRYYVAADTYARSDQSINQQLSKTIDSLSSTSAEPTRLLADYDASSKACFLDPGLRITVVFDNLAVHTVTYDYLLLRRTANSLDPKLDLAAIPNAQVRADLVADAPKRRLLLDQGRLNGAAYTLVRSIGPYDLFKAKRAP